MYCFFINLEKVLIGREYGGPVRRKLLVPISLYGKTKLLKRTVGHLSSVYCVLFDRTGRYIITVTNSNTKHDR